MTPESRGRVWRYWGRWWWRVERPGLVEETGHPCDTAAQAADHARSALRRLQARRARLLRQNTLLAG